MWQAIKVERKRWTWQHKTPPLWDSFPSFVIFPQRSGFRGAAVQFHSSSDHRSGICCPCLLGETQKFFDKLNSLQGTDNVGSPTSRIVLFSEGTPQLQIYLWTPALITCTAKPCPNKWPQRTLTAFSLQHCDQMVATVHFSWWINWAVILTWILILLLLCMLHDMILPCLLSVSKIDGKRFSLILSSCSWNKINDRIDQLITDHSNYIFRSYWL